LQVQEQHFTVDVVPADDVEVVDVEHCVELRRIQAEKKLLVEASRSATASLLHAGSFAVLQTDHLCILQGQLEVVLFDLDQGQLQRVQRRDPQRLVALDDERDGVVAVLEGALLKIGLLQVARLDVGGCKTILKISL
jgi:hypothetical protein